MEKSVGNTKKVNFTARKKEYSLIYFQLIYLFATLKFKLHIY